jgi:hypothetical protein
MSFAEYLASIDWIGALILGVLMVAVGLAILRFLVAATAEVGAILPGATDAAGRAILDARTDMPVDSWVCASCRSVNIPTATVCYRGCGPRAELGRLLHEDPSIDGAARSGRET